jgi:ELWxxDGT repeat protein
MSLGTAASTRLLAASFNSVGWSSDDSNPVGLDDLAGKLLFTANDGAAGYEPWVSDGSPSGTRLLADLRTGAADSIWNGDSSAPSTSEMPKAIAWDAAFFMAWDNSGGPSLWVSDGTAAGTARIRQFENILYGWRFEGVGVGDHVYFLGRDAGRFGLWVTYGSAATTTLLYPNIWPVSFSALGNTAFFFNATSSYQASGLWRTNGQQVASVIPALQVNTIDIHVEREGRSLYLLTLDAAYNAILRRLTETGPPTTVKSFRAAPPSSGHARRLLANVGGTLFFPAAGAAGGVDLWRSDGTAANTTIVTNFGAAGSMDELTEVGSDLYFTIATPNLDFELWKTDGTAAGTVRLLRLLGGTPNRPLIGSVIAVGTRRACFSAVTGGLFPGLWITDGTVAGTQPILTETWRYYGAEPAALSNGHLFALVNDKVYGKELASVAFTGVAHHSGTGCSGSGYPPELSATDPVLGANSTIAVRNAIPNSAGMLLIGAPSSPQRLSHGCSLHIGLAGAFPVPFRTDAAGRWVQPGVAVPNLPALIGARVTLQAGVGPASTPPLGLDLSGGVLMVVGR